MRRPLARGIVPLAALVLTLAACTPPQGASGSNPEPSESGSPSASSSPSASASSDPGANAGTDIDAVFAQGLPPGVPEQTVDTPGGAGWSVAGYELYVVTYGSSSCPTVANEITVVDGAPLAVELIETGGAVCTADIAPTTSTVAIPGGIDTAVQQVIKIGDLGEVTVPPATGVVTLGWLPPRTP